MVISETQTKCPLDKEGRIVSDNECLMLLLQKQQIEGFIAARGKCKTCGEVVRIGRFEIPSSESLTDINENY